MVILPAEHNERQRLNQCEIEALVIPDLIRDLENIEVAILITGYQIILDVIQDQDDVRGTTERTR